MTEKQIVRELYDEKKYYSAEIADKVSELQKLAEAKNLPFISYFVIAQQEDGFECSLTASMAGEARTPKEIIPFLIAMKGNDKGQFVPNAFVEQACLAMSLIDQIIPHLPEELQKLIAEKFEELEGNEGLTAEEEEAAAASPKFALA